MLIAGDPEKEHIALCEKIGGIPYHLKQIDFGVSSAKLFIYLLLNKATAKVL